MCYLLKQLWGGGGWWCSSALQEQASCSSWAEGKWRRKRRCSHFLAPTHCRCSPRSRTSTPDGWELNNVRINLRTLMQLHRRHVPYSRYQWHQHSQWTDTPPGPHSASSQTRCLHGYPSCGGCDSIWHLENMTRLHSPTYFRKIVVWCPKIPSW